MSVNETMNEKEELLSVEHLEVTFNNSRKHRFRKISLRPFAALYVVGMRVGQQQVADFEAALFHRLTQLPLLRDVAASGVDDGCIPVVIGNQICVYKDLVKYKTMYVHFRGWL